LPISYITALISRPKLPDSSSQQHSSPVSKRLALEAKTKTWFSDKVTLWMSRVVNQKRKKWWVKERS